ncbi:MAG: hypothetical protein AAF721_11980 [Myxococcota bacterium]
MKFAGGIVLAHSLALLLVAPLVACPADDGSDTAGDSGSVDETASPDQCPIGDFGMGTDGATNNLMETWGAGCETDADCVALIGDGAICQDMAVIYELPGKYCTKPCELPDEDTRTVFDAMDCDPAGGVACIGLKGFFERCALLCTDDMQCTREGYYCRRMPMISDEADPKSCLMPDCCESSCAGG